MLAFILKYLWLKLKLQIVGAWKIGQEQIWDRHRVPRDLPQGNGSTVVITGGNRGIGFEAVKTFVNLGYHVIIGCRKPGPCKENLLKCKNSGEISETGSYECLELNLMSMDSVRKFAQVILDKNTPVHILANNAGIMFGPRRETEDGFESQFSTNYLGHFLLTDLLLPRLKEAGTMNRKARIFNVTSVAHRIGDFLDIEDLQCKKFYSPEGGYGNSKLAQIMYTRYLSDSFQSSSNNYHVTVNCAHPGIVKTGLYEHSRYMTTLFGILFKTPKQGGDCILHGCLAPEIEGKSGLYFENSQPRTPSSKALDVELQKKLWNKSLEILKL